MAPCYQIDNIKSRGFVADPTNDPLPKGRYHFRHGNKDQAGRSGAGEHSGHGLRYSGPNGRKGFMMRSVAPLIVSGALLSGCGVTAKIDARQEYQTSTAAYKNCLTINPPANCEGLRLAMEADAQRFNNLSAATGSSAGIMTIFNPQ